MTSLETLKDWFVEDDNDTDVSPNDDEIIVSRVNSWVTDAFDWAMGELRGSQEIIEPNHIRFATFKGNKVKLSADYEYEKCPIDTYTIDLPQDETSPEFEGVMMFIDDWLNEVVDVVEIEEINKRIKELEALC